MTEPFDVGPPPPALFRVETAVEGTIAHVAAIGDLDLSSVGSLEAAARGVLEQRRISRLILDLRRVTFLDSTGLRLLLELDGEARDEGWRLTVVRGPEEVQRAIEMIGLQERLEIVDDPPAVREGSTD